MSRQPLYSNVTMWHSSPCICESPACHIASFFWLRQCQRLEHMLQIKPRSCVWFLATLDATWVRPSVALSHSPCKDSRPPSGPTGPSLYMCLFQVQNQFHFKLLFFFFDSCNVKCRLLVPWSGIEHVPLAALGTQNLNHWRKFPT